MAGKVAALGPYLDKVKLRSHTESEKFSVENVAEPTLIFTPLRYRLTLLQMTAQQRHFFFGTIMRSGLLQVPTPTVGLPL